MRGGASGLAPADKDLLGEVEIVAVAAAPGGGASAAEVAVAAGGSARVRNPRVSNAVTSNAVSNRARPPCSFGFERRNIRRGGVFHVQHLREKNPQ